MPGPGRVEDEGGRLGTCTGDVEDVPHEYEGLSGRGRGGYHGVVTFVQGVEGDGLVTVDGGIRVYGQGRGPSQVVGNGVYA